MWLHRLCLGVVDQHHAPAAFVLAESHFTYVEEGGWAPRLVWRGLEERQSLPQGGSNPQHFTVQRVGNIVVPSLKHVYPYLHSAVGLWRGA